MSFIKELWNFIKLEKSFGESFYLFPLKGFIQNYSLKRSIQVSLNGNRRELCVSVFDHIF
jgi:hypothetical protein